MFDRLVQAIVSLQFLQGVELASGKLANFVRPGIPHQPVRKCSSFNAIAPSE